jgi:hypothetical protein
MDLEDLDWESCYPDPLRGIRGQIVPHRFVIDPSVPNEHCIVIEWTDQEGKHVCRFLKDEYVEKKVPEALPKVLQAKEEIGRLTSFEALTSKPPDYDTIIQSFELLQSWGEETQKALEENREILRKNLEHPEIFEGLLSDLGRERLQRIDQKCYNIIIITGPRFSGKSFLMDIISYFLGARNVLQFDREHLITNSFSGVHLRHAQVKQLAMFDDVITYAHYYEQVWRQMKLTSQAIPVLACIDESGLNVIPPEDQKKCIILRCKRTLSLVERDIDLRSIHGIEKIASVYRRVYKK